MYLLKKSFLFTAVLYNALVFAPISYAQPDPQVAPLPQTQSYSAKVGDKALNGITNIATGFLEIPKNMINISNDKNSNIFYGIVGGGIKGIMDTMGRMSAGAADLITAPLPTKPISNPNYIWQDFDANTSYDPMFRLEEPKK